MNRRGRKLGGGRTRIFGIVVSSKDKEELAKEYGQQYRKLKDIIHARKANDRIQREPVSRTTMVLGIIGIILLILLTI